MTKLGEWKPKIRHPQHISCFLTADATGENASFYSPFQPRTPPQPISETAIIVN